jgi:hypothetical protein
VIGLIAFALPLVVGSLLGGCATAPARIEPHAPRQSAVAPETWLQMGAATRAAAADAERATRASARAALDHWAERVRGRTEAEFIPWATGYWTHQWLELRLAWYRAQAPAGEDGTDRLAAYLAERYREMVLDPVARDTSPAQIANEATRRFLQDLAAQVNVLAARFDLPDTALMRWLDDVPAITDPPGASLGELIQRGDVVEHVAYRALVASTCGATDRVDAYPLSRPMQAAASRAADRLATALAVRGSATAASVLGGVPGLVIGMGITAWDASTYAQERSALESALRSDLEDMLEEARRTLYEDPSRGVLAPVFHIAANLAAALPEAPDPDARPQQTDDGFPSNDAVQAEDEPPDALF